MPSTKRTVALTLGLIFVLFAAAGCGEGDSPSTASSGSSTVEPSFEKIDELQDKITALEEKLEKVEEAAEKVKEEATKIKSNISEVSDEMSAFEDGGTDWKDVVNAVQVQMVDVEFDARHLESAVDDLEDALSETIL